MAPGFPASVAVIGLGYVGLPLAVAFAEAGVSVLGVDRSEAVVAGLRAGRSHIEDVPAERLGAVLERLDATTSTERLPQADAVLICVPTPLNANREPDLTALTAASDAVAGQLRAGQTVVLESTTYPGTTREQLVPTLERGSGLVAGTDFHVAYSPERIDPGRTDFTLATTPKTVGGYTDACGAAARDVYATVCEDVRVVSSPDVAELSKLLENVFRSVNIALVNELAMLCDRMGLDIREVVDAAASKPYGFMRFDPGPGMGGHCLPVDPFYLAWRAREFDFSTEFVELAGKINQQMPYHCVQRAERALNDQGKAVRGSRIAILGVAYKRDVGDIRESPALKIVALLRALGADVRYHDPHVEALPELELRHEPLDRVLADADLTVIVTPHSHVDYDAVATDDRIVLDLRGVVADRRRPSVYSL
ncbi:nucleotide sugar dehydrogenase [Patulibacter sp. SYSU D01012]|uniref:nucleotide sugar dehydrogenase n=1 Tax=Patulibacter sp. SYSU D01012 TaxID=2817381 RepID=UPI001B315AE3|nr:nucleotide sugar dehydrogenase [Patulibacter sp. SYSU D01012]